MERNYFIDEIGQYPMPGIDGKPFSIVLDRREYKGGEEIIMDKSGIYYQVQKTRFFWLTKLLVRLGLQNPMKLTTIKVKPKFKRYDVDKRTESSSRELL